MTSTPPQDPPDATQQRQRDILDLALETLRATLPPPSENTPEARARRDRVALAKVTALRPAHPVEAQLAALYIATTGYAGYCSSDAAQHAADPPRAAPLLAEAASLRHEARRYLGELLHLQEARQQCEATAAGRASPALIEQTMFGLESEALERLTARPPPAAGPQVDRRGPPRPLDRPKDPGPRGGNVVAWPQSPPNPTIH